MDTIIEAIHKVLCKVGVHDWNYYINGFMRDPNAVEARCIYCNKEKLLVKIKKV